MKVPIVYSWPFAVKDEWLTQLGDHFWNSRQIGTNLHLNGFREWVLLFLTAIVTQDWAKYNGSLTQTRHFQTRLDQAVFKLNWIVVLVHQLPNLKRILFKKRSIFHLPYAECCKVVWIFNNCHCWKRTSYQKSFAVFQLGRDSPYTS